VEAALDEPARPLFLGRKPCLPTGRIAAGIIEAESLLAALNSLPQPAGTAARALLPASEPRQAGDQVSPWSDMRDWHSGVHGGTRQVLIRCLPVEPGVAS
jgi:CRISPR system Cascade subunit CasD